MRRRPAFTPGNATPQTVSVKTIEDEPVADSTTILFASGGVPSTSVLVDVADNDAQAIVADTASLLIAEGAAECAVHLCVRALGRRCREAPRRPMGTRCRSSVGSLDLHAGQLERPADA